MPTTYKLVQQTIKQVENNDYRKVQEVIATGLSWKEAKKRRNKHVKAVREVEAASVTIQ